MKNRLGMGLPHGAAHATWAAHAMSLLVIPSFRLLAQLGFCLALCCFPL